MAINNIHNITLSSGQQPNAIKCNIYYTYIPPQ